MTTFSFLRGFFVFFIATDLKSLICNDASFTQIWIRFVDSSDEFHLARDSGKESSIRWSWIPFTDPNEMVYYTL